MRARNYLPTSRASSAAAWKKIPATGFRVRATLATNSATWHGLHHTPRPFPLLVRTPRSPASGTARSHEGFWIAVLPFKCTGTSADLTALAEGLSEEVITGLSRFSYLRVIGRRSTVKYISESMDVRAIGKELGARYVMEGSLRQARTKLRLAVQLVEATTGSPTPWADTFERTFTPETVFELQDDLVPRIVSTIADEDLARRRTAWVKLFGPRESSS